MVVADIKEQFFHVFLCVFLKSEVFFFIEDVNQLHEVFFDLWQCHYE